MTKKKSFLRRCLGLCWGTAAFGIILFALLVAIGRMLLPLVADYRVEIQQALSQKLGREVQITRIQTDWSGIWPRIHLSGIDVSNRKKEKWLHINDVMLSIDLGLLWSGGKQMPGQVSLGGINLDVSRNTDKTFSVNGEKFALDKNTPEDQRDFVRWLFSLNSALRIRDSALTWRDLRLQKKSISITTVDVTLINKNGTHHLFGRFGMSEQNQKIGTLSFVFDMNGDMLEPQKVTHKFYVNGDVTVSEWMRNWMRPYLAIQEGRFGLEVWGQGVLGQVDKMKSIFNGYELTWKHRQTHAVKNSITAISANIFWNRLPQGWSLDVESLNMADKIKVRKTAQVRLVYSKQNKKGLQKLEMELAHIQLNDIHTMLSRHLAASKIGRVSIDELTPDGELKKLQLRFEGNEEKILHYYAQAEFTGLGFERGGDLPGVKGLNGSFLFTGNAGVFSLNSPSSTIDFGRMFKKPVKAYVKGDLFWQKTDQGFVVETSQLVARNKHVKTVSAIKILFPKKGKPFLDMVMDLKDGDAAFASLYLPANVMKKDVRFWLERALMRGKATSGKMILHGPMNKFPFYHNEGTFMVDFSVKDLDLNYAKGWPVLSGIDANVLFDGPGLKVSLQKSMLMNTRVLPSTIIIKDLGKAAVLETDVRLVGTSTSLLNYLRNTPVKIKAGSFLSNVKGSGDAQVVMNMRIPLLHPEKFSIKGFSDFTNTNITIKPAGKVFKKLNGRMNFQITARKSFFKAKDMRLMLQGRPARLDIMTSKSRNAGNTITLDLKARLDISKFAKDHVAALSAAFKGVSDWQLMYLIQPGKKSRLILKSDLKGTQINLPDQFFKPAKRRQSIRVNLDFNESGVSALDLKLNGLMDMQTRFKADKFERGIIWFGAKQKQLKKPVRSGMVIGGHVTSLAVEKWLDVFPVSSDSALKTSVFSQIRAIDLQVSRVESGHLVLNKLQVKAKRANKVLVTDLFSNEIAGKIYIPDSLDGKDPVKVRLKYLKLKTYADKVESSVPDPRNLPALDVESKKIMLNGKTLGLLRLKTFRKDKGLSISGLQLRGQYISVDAEGTWYLKDSWHQSKFTVHVNTPHIGKAMEMFRYQSSFAEGKANARFTASWSGPPHWLEMKRLNGQIKLSIKKGRLSDIDPGSGRIFGLLSIQSLQRRLSLDFSDFFKKGFSFDKIEGSFTVSDGDAYTNDLYLDGPAARIDISGRIGLSAQDYDETIYVTPKVSSSIPLLGLAASPQVAVGLLLTEKLFRKDVNKMTARSYTVTGSWEKPVITKNKPQKAPATNLDTE